MIEHRFRHVDGREGFGANEKESYCFTVFDIVASDGQRHPVVLSPVISPFGEGWYWWCDCFGQQPFWAALGKTIGPLADLSEPGELARKDALALDACA